MIHYSQGLEYGMVVHTHIPTKKESTHAPSSAALLRFAAAFRPPRVLTETPARASAHKNMPMPVSRGVGLSCGGVVYVFKRGPCWIN